MADATIGALKLACLDENQVVALVHGRLYGEELRGAQEHLDGCMDCLDLVGLFQQTTLGDGTEDDFVPLTESEEINLNAPAGSKIGRYQVIRPLGRGGMGVVYLAFDPELDRPVALKLVKPSLQDDERAFHFERRLKREARALAKLSHANVLTIYDVGNHEGQVFLASEWVDGGTLEDWMAEGPHRWRAVAERFRDAARGLVAAHEAGLIHRDFKPSNVMVSKDGRVLVFDFGLVKTTSANLGDITTQLSGKFVVGTPAYMSPEQLAGEPASEQSDQFSFCASLYEAISGRRPYSGRNLMELLSNIEAEKLEEPKNAPKWLWDMLKRGLRRNPAERFASMAAVLGIMDKGIGHRRRRSVIAALAVGAVGAVAAGGVGYWQGHTDLDSLCSDSRSALGKAWSQERRDAVREGILSSDAPYAPDAWRNASRLIDLYARDWQLQTRSSCMETKVYKSQSAEVFESRASCFSRLRTELDSVTTRLQVGDDDSVRTAVALAQSLSDVGDCSAERLVSEALPLDVAERERLEAIWPELKTIDTLITTHKYEEARGRAVALMAQTHGHRATEARLWAAQGTALRMMGKYEEAIEVLEKAFYSAVAGKNDELAARATADIFDLYAARLEDADAAERWRQLAESAVERAGSPAVSGKWLRIQGSDALKRNALDDAEALFSASIEVLEKEFGPYHNQVAASLEGLGNCYIVRQQPAQAEGIYRRAVEIWMATGGPNHPDTAMSQTRLAAALMEQRKVAEAQSLVEGAVDVLVASYGEQNPRVGAAINSLAEYAVAAGDFEAANRTLLRALAIKRSVHGSDHARLASTLMNLMDVDRSRGRPSDGVIHGSEALRILLAQSEGETSPQIQQLVLGIADARLASADPKTALAECESLRETLRPLEDVGATAMGRVASCIGRAHMALGNPGKAKEWLTNSVKLFGEDGARLRLGEALFALARMGEDSAEAIAQAKESFDYFAEAGPSWSAELVEVREWLGARGVELPAARTP